jgi:hypothetical protein
MSHFLRHRLIAIEPALCVASRDSCESNAGPMNRGLATRKKGDDGSELLVRGLREVAHVMVEAELFAGDEKVLERTA